MQTKYDLVIKDGLVIGSRRIARVDVGIKAGKISTLAPGLNESDATEVIDAAGQYVLPGLLDVHVHPVYVDTIADCSLLGAFGGITTMIHYAYAHPGKGLADTVEEFPPPEEVCRWMRRSGLADVAGNLESRQILLAENLFNQGSARLRQKDYKGAAEAFTEAYGAAI